MRYVRLLFLHMQHLSEQRSRSFVWFLVAFVNPLSIIFFWRGGTNFGTTKIAGFDFPSLVTYYILLVIGGSLIMSHVENDVSEKDIQQGNLVAFLLKPFSYLWFRFFSEFPWRILQGFYGILFLILILILFPKIIAFSFSPTLFFMALVMAVIAHVMAFYFKMVLGTLAFWFVDTNGLFQTVDLLVIILAGFLAPLPFLPYFLSKIAYFLPFSYMIYFPVVAFLGKLTIQESLQIILIQFFWLIFFYLTFKFVWNKGLKIFTGVGQ